jgi:hypothetical protein
MSATDSIEPYPHADKARHLDNGIVKFPVNVHGIYVEKSKVSGYTTITAKQNDLVLRFVIDEDACQHLAVLLIGDIKAAPKE